MEVEKERGPKRQSRQERILSRLRALQGELTVEQLAETFSVSPLTIRRDLDELERGGMILRTHGGCVLRTSMESSYHRRAALSFELKEAIGRAAAAELDGATTILINDGSTTFHLATQLHGRTRLTVYTNSIAMVRELARFPDIRIFVLGGEFDRDLSLLGGQLTEQVVESLCFDVVFLGADAIDPTGACQVATFGEGRLTQVMLRRGRRKVLLADHTKCQAQGHATYARLADFDLWITTPGIPEALRQEFQKLVKIKEASL
ncbi:MAG: DeoR/GlpR family DNA-binding transcription regulator [Acidobacteriota bacterium]